MTKNELERFQMWLAYWSGCDDDDDITLRTLLFVAMVPYLAISFVGTAVCLIAGSGNTYEHLHDWLTMLITGLAVYPLVITTAYSLKLANSAALHLRRKHPAALQEQSKRQRAIAELEAQVFDEPTSSH